MPVPDPVWVLLGVREPLPLLPVDRVGSLLVGVGVAVRVGAGVLRTGTVGLVTGALVVVRVGAGVLVETRGVFTGVVFFTTLAVVLAVALDLGFAELCGGVFAFAFVGLAAGL